MLTVLHLVPDMDSYGGTPIQRVSMVRHAPRHDIRDVFLVFKDAPESLVGELRSLGAPVHVVERRSQFRLDLVADVVRLCRACSPDVLVTNFARADILGTLAGRLAGVPVVKWVHSIAWNDSRFLQWTDRLLAGSRSLTICNSLASRDALLRAGYRGRLAVLHNGIEDITKRASRSRAEMRSELGCADADVVVGHVGAMNALRDPLTIVAAVAMLAAQAENWRLVIAGEGPMKGEVVRRARALGIEHRVTLLGNRRDIADLHRAFDMYVNVAPREAFGIAVVEAMQSQLPVVVSNVGGLPELIEDGVSGLLVRPGDPRALMSALESIAGDNGRAEALGAAARDRALRLFGAERFAADRVALVRAAAAHEAVVEPRFHPA